MTTTNTPPPPQQQQLVEKRCEGGGASCQDSVDGEREKENVKIETENGKKVWM